MKTRWPRRRDLRDASDRQLPRVYGKLKRIARGIPHVAKDSGRTGRNPHPSAGWGRAGFEVITTKAGHLSTDKNS